MTFSVWANDELEIRIATTLTESMKIVLLFFTFDPITWQLRMLMVAWLRTAMMPISMNVIPVIDKRSFVTVSNANTAFADVKVVSRLLAVR